MAAQIACNSSAEITQKPTVTGPCAGAISPTASQFLAMLPTGGIIALSLLTVLSLLTIVNYLHMVYFVHKKFKIRLRRVKTIWVLTAFPIYSGTALIGLYIPAAASLFAAFANLFFATVLYHLIRLYVNYMGGVDRMWSLVLKHDYISFAGPPLCCFLCWLPKMKMNREFIFRTTLQILQVCVIRPLLNFIAVVLVMNNPAGMANSNIFWFIVAIEISSTWTSVYGLSLLRNSLAPYLLQEFSIRGKIATFQLTIFTTSFTGITLVILHLIGGIVPCWNGFTAKTVSTGLYCSLVIIYMSVLSLAARIFYIRESDGEIYAQNTGNMKNVIDPEPEPEDIERAEREAEESKYEQIKPPIWFTETKI